MAQSVQLSSIKNYLSAIKHFHSYRRYALNLLVFLLLQLILHGIMRFQGVNSQARRPVTLHIINLFYHLNVKFITNKDSLQITFRMNWSFEYWTRQPFQECNNGLIIWILNLLWKGADHCWNQKPISDWTMWTRDAPYMEYIISSQNGSKEPAWANLRARKTSLWPV